MNKKIIGLLLVASSVLATPAWAVPVIDGFTGGDTFSSFYGSSTGDVVGFAFTADVDLTVTDLGVLNDFNDGVLDSAHMVGLWDATSQALLGSVSVDSSGTLIGDFYYATLGSSINLTAGMEYVLGAMYTATDDDTYVSSPSSIDLVNISMTNGVFPDSGDLGFVFPGSDSTNLARMGPNMLADPTVASVPEPASLLLVGLGLLGVVRARRAR